MEMVTVHFKLNSIFYRLVNDKNLFELKVIKETPVSQVVASFADRQGPKLKKALFDNNGNLNAEIVIIIDKQYIPGSLINTTPIKQDCQMIITPVVGGG